MTKATDSTFRIVAAELASAFESGKRDGGGSFYTISDTAPLWIRGQAGRDLMFDVLNACDDGDGRLPNDWIFEESAGIAYSLAHDYTCDTASDAREIATELADSRVDVYNAALVEWLAASPIKNGALVEAAKEEISPEGDLYSQIGRGQYVGILRIAYALIDAIETEADRRDETRLAMPGSCPDDLSDVRIA